MGIFNKLLIGFTLAGPLVLLMSVAALGVGISTESNNTSLPTSTMATNAGGLKSDCAGSVIDPKFIPFINDAALQFNVPAPVIAGVIERESHGDPTQKSNAGAQGLMQVMPGTWNGIRTVKSADGTYPGQKTVVLNIKEPNVVANADQNRAGKDLSFDNHFDPEANIYAGTFYLKQNLNKFHDIVPLALAAYNAGPNRPSLLLGLIPSIPETVEYVRIITKEFIPKYQKCLDQKAATGAAPTNNAEARTAVLAAAHAAEGKFPAGIGKNCGLQARAVYLKAGIEENIYNTKPAFASAGPVNSSTAAASLQPGYMVRMYYPENGSLDHMIILDSSQTYTLNGQTVVGWSYWTGDASHKYQHSTIPSDPSRVRWNRQSFSSPLIVAPGFDSIYQVWAPQLK